MSWTEPIIDRTIEDVRYAKLLNDTAFLNNLTPAQRTEFTTTNLKGCINQSDYNRIMGNIKCFSPMFTFSNTFQSMTNYFPQCSDFLNLQNTMNSLIYNATGGYSISVTDDNGNVITGTVPALKQNMDNQFEFTPLPYTYFEDWNSIEKVLYCLWQMWAPTNDVETYAYTGTELYGGEFGLL